MPGVPIYPGSPCPFVVLTDSRFEEFAESGYASCCLFWCHSLSVVVSVVVSWAVLEGPVDVEVSSVVLPGSGAGVSVYWVVKISFR